MTLDDILDEIKNVQNIVILTHENPDGDAIGSSTAMALALKNMGKTVDILMKEYPANFSYLPGIENIKLDLPESHDYDMAIVLDCPDIKRVPAGLITYFDHAKVKVEFDHHNKNSMFADYNIVDPVSPACAQVLVSSFEYLNINITKDIATCLLTGIITDTGGFKNSGITAATFDFASWALESGVNIPKIYREAMMIMSKAKFEVQKLCMNRMEFYADGKIAFTYLTGDDSRRVGLKAGDHEGVVEIGRDIEGVEVSIFLYERDKGYKASFRSNDYVNVSEICMYFGGGGHIKAAGANINMPFEEARKVLIEETMKYLK